MTESLWLSFRVSGAFVQALGLTLLNSVWQCAVIGLVAWLALHTLRNATPQARYAVACSALAACVLWPAAQLARALAAPQSTLPVAALSTLVDESAQAATTHVLHPFGAIPLDRMLPWIVALWVVGTSLMLLRLLMGLRWVARLRRGALTPGDPTWQRRLDRLAQSSGLSNIRLAVLDDDWARIGGPLAAGIWRPVVMVPAALLARMPVEMLDALLAHELAHIRRHDYLINLLQRVAEALLFHHPVAWWLSQRIRQEREFVADALAAEVIGEPRRLAHALAELDRLAPTTPSLAQAAHGGHLMSRIQSLLRPQPRTSAGMILLPIAGLALACIGFLAYAQSAQTRTPAAIAPKVTVGALTAAGAVASASSTSTDTYAIVEGDSDRLSMSGSTDDIDAIRAAQARIDGDFLWFRRDGKVYVLRDPDMLQRVREAWSAGAERDAQMEALSVQMQAQAAQTEAIGRRMEALTAGHGQSPEMQKAIGALHASGERMGALAQQKATLAIKMAADPGDEKAMAEAEGRMDALDAQMEKLDAEMESLGSLIETESAKLETDLAPLVAMESEIEAATAPLEALDAKMEALSNEQERDMVEIDRKIWSIADEASAKGLASPAGDRQE